MHSFDHPWKCHSAKFEGCAFIFKAKLHFISYRTIFLWYQKELKVKWGRSIDETRLSCYLNESIWKDWVFVREKFYWQCKISYRRGNLLALFSWRCLSYETLIKKYKRYTRLWIINHNFRCIFLNWTSNKIITTHPNLFYSNLC